jgi:hypothetical protein
MGLDDQVHMIALHGEMHDAELPTLGRSDGARDGFEDAWGAQGGQPGERPQRDVDRVTVTMPQTGAVEDARSGAWLAPRARTPPAPGVGDGQEKLSGSPWHLE